MRSGPRMSRPDRVRRAVKKFDLSPGAIEAALDRIKAKLAEREREKSSNLLGNKEGRKQIQMLRDAARKTLGYTRSDRLPPTLRNVIAATDVPAMLEELCKWCEVVLGKKLTPKRDDGYEKLLAAEEAWRPQSLKHWSELTAILYGTGEIADVSRACRAFRDRLRVKFAAAETDVARLGLEQPQKE